MLNKLLSYGAAEALGRGLNWLLVTSLALVLPLHEYGLVGMMVALEAVATNVFLLGQDRAVLRFYRPDRVDEGVLGSSLLVWLAGAIPLFVGIGAFAYIKRTTFFGIPLWPHVVLVCAAAIPMQLAALHLAMLRVEGRAESYLAWRVGTQLLKVGLVLLVVFVTRRSVGYAIGLFASAALGAVLRLPTLARRARGRFWWAKGKELLIFGWPFVFHSLSGMLLMFADRFMLEHYMGKEAVGAYTFAYMLGSSVVFLYGVSALLFEPYLYRSDSNPEATERRLGAYLAALIGAGSAAGLFILALLPILGSRHLQVPYADLMVVTPVVLAAHILHPLYLQGNLRLMLLKRSRVIMYGSSVAAVVNVVGNILLIPHLGVQGAAIATLCSIVLLALILLVSSWSIAGLRLRQVVARPVLFAAPAAAALMAAFPGRVVGYVAIGALSLFCWVYLLRSHASTLRRVLTFS